MSATESAFVMTVLRYATLRHAAAPPSNHSGELTELEGILCGRQTEPDRRAHRRMEVYMDAVLRDGSGQAPAEVVDISGGGLRVRNAAQHPAHLGDRLTVSLFPGDANLRVDVPVEVVSQPAQDHLGLRFCGPPLQLRCRVRTQHRGPARQGVSTLALPTLPRRKDAA